MTTPMKKLVIVGGGFAGLWAALSAARENHLKGDPLEISLISRDPFLTLRPRLYQENPETLRTPLRSSLDPVGVALIVGDVTAIDSGNLDRRHHIGHYDVIDAWQLRSLHRNDRYRRWRINRLHRH